MQENVAKMYGAPNFEFGPRNSSYSSFNCRRFGAL